MLLDSSLSNVQVGVLVTTPAGSTPSEKFSIVLDNVVHDNVPQAVMHLSAGTYLTGGSKTIDSWVLGKVYDTNHVDGTPLQGNTLPDKRPRIESLMKGKAYFEREKPQYNSLDAGTFINVHPVAAGEPLFLPSSLLFASLLFRTRRDFTCLLSIYLQHTHLLQKNHWLTSSLRIGDAVTDDTFSLSLMFAVALEQNRPLYIPMGSYIATSTIKVGV